MLYMKSNSKGVAREILFHEMPLPKEGITSKVSSYRNVKQKWKIKMYKHTSIMGL